MVVISSFCGGRNGNFDGTDRHKRSGGAEDRRRGKGIPQNAEAALRAREEKLTAELERDEERRLAADMALREKKIVAEIAAKQKEVERLAAEMEKRFADQKQTWIDGVVRQITEAAE